MPRSAASLIERALQIAKIPGYTAQALDELNSLCGHIARTIDFSAARGEFNFTFNTNLVSSGAGNIVTASPNPLPLDYLRVPVSTGSTGSQRSSKWYIEGVPYDMVEIDLTEWDDQVQQPGIQSYPYFWAKDMSLWNEVGQYVGDLNSGSQSVVNLATTPDASGNAIGPLSNIEAGMSAYAGIGPLSVLVPGTTITAVDLAAYSLTLSQAPTMSLTGATLVVGNPAVAYPYPPPSGAFPVLLRYQRQMPPLTQPQVNNGAFPWFPDDMVLLEGLAGLMLRYADDSRVAEYIGAGLGGQDEAGGRFGRRLAQYIKTADDNANRAKLVELDRRVFGRSFSALKNTKTVGW